MHNHLMIPIVVVVVVVVVVAIEGQDGEDGPVREEPPPGSSIQSRYI